MRTPIKVLLPALAASLLLAACGGGSGSSQSNALVSTASNDTLGKTVLVNASGRTLYSLSAERNGRFICDTGACLKLWHPLKAPLAGVKGGDVSSLGTVKRPDGSLQVTFRGMPLYTFAADKRAGQAQGQGFKDVGVWSAAAVKPAKPAPTPSGGGYGSGY